MGFRAVIATAVGTLLLAAGAAASAQESRPPIPVLAGSAQSFLARLPAEPPPDPRSQAAQQFAQALPAVGREDLWASLPRPMDIAAVCDAIPHPEGPIEDRVVELAAATQVVIVNEAHDIPWHRRFTESLLAPLRERGYRYFAAETFSEQVDAYPAEPFGRLDAGFYSTEPAFGDLIRTAKRLGYTLVPYEAEPFPRGMNGTTADRVAFREEGQANHLIERVLADDPAAKLIVHVGYSHATEVPIPSFNGSTMPWMAARLKAKTGIDPLTIDQTFCRAAGAAPVLARPTSALPAGAFDIAIAYPEVSLERGRAAWRRFSDRRFIDLPAEMLPADARAIVEARYADEPAAAIPVDRLLVRPGESIPLVLPPGKFKIDVWTDDAGDGKSFEIEVDETTVPTAERTL